MIRTKKIDKLLNSSGMKVVKDKSVSCKSKKSAGTITQFDPPIFIEIGRVRIRLANDSVTKKALVDFFNAVGIDAKMNKGISVP